MLLLSDDLQWYIWKIYYSHHVLSLINETVLKAYYSGVVFTELMTYSIGDQVGNLINIYYNEFPDDQYVLTNDMAYWDPIYFMLIDAHLQKRIDLFLFTSVKDAIQSLHIKA